MSSKQAGKSPIRIGFIGAGAIARTRHLPELARISQAQVVAVSNRTRASAVEISEYFHIDRVEENWRKILEDSDIDAVFIGTWPATHMEMSVAALEAGKHVFCQARMAMDLGQAKKMLAAAQNHPQLVNMICPPPTRMPYENFIKKIIADGQLGQIVSVELTSISGANLDRTQTHWREKVELSGRQILAMGIYAETLHALVGPYSSVSAQLSTPIASKQDETGQQRTIGVPQVVTISGRLVCGANIVEHHLGLATDTSTRGDCLTIWGLEGTLRYHFTRGILELATKGGELKPVSVPADQQRPWQVERDFIEAVQLAREGKKWKVSPDFQEGLLYMRKVEAVHVAAESGRAVEPGNL